MKYIKFFEKQEIKYWLVPFDDRFESVLKQIGTPDYDINMFLSFKETQNKAGFRPKYIWLTNDFEHKISWMKYKGTERENFFEDFGYIFSGYCLTRKEIEEENFNWSINKYNL